MALREACPHPAGSCSGWGDTHYETFDGTSYSFLDDCTHVLMREIQPRHGNLSILLHNHYCEAAASCPRALSVHYESMDIVLTTTPGADGQEESLVSAGSRAALACPNLVREGRGQQRPGSPGAHRAHFPRVEGSSHGASGEAKGTLRPGVPSTVTPEQGSSMGGARGQEHPRTQMRRL